jgi:hypothetical protein
MKKRIFLALSVLWLTALSGSAAVLRLVPVKRTVTKTYTVTNGARLSIENKYGKVNLHTWNKDQIQAVITITTDGSTAENAQELSKQVEIVGNASSGNVSLVTKYDPGTSGSFWKRFFGGTGDTRKYVHIDYEVYMPNSVSATTIKNNYGDVAADGISGDLILRMNYGNFHLGKIGGKLDLNANYCKGVLTGSESGTLQTNYTDVNLNDVGDLTIHANYCDYKIGKGGKISYHGSYGDLVAQDIEAIESHTNYIDYKIGTVTQGVDMSVTYGNVSIGQLGGDFKGLSLKGNYANVSIGVPGSLALRANIQLSYGSLHTGDLSFPSVQKDDHGKSTTLKGATSGAGTSAPLLEISGNYTDVSLKKK